MGYARTGTPECWIQGILTNYNFLSSVLWTVVIAYELFLVVNEMSSTKSLLPFKLFIYIFPLFVTLLPLTTNTYGLPDDDRGWCFIANRKSGSPKWGITTWEILSFYLWLWISILGIAALFLMIFIRLRKLRTVSPAISKYLYRMVLYPIILIVCWTIPTIEDICAASYEDCHTLVGYEAMDVISKIFPPLQGFLLTVVFFSRNDLVMYEWYRYLTGTQTDNEYYSLLHEPFKSGPSEIESESLASASSQSFSQSQSFSFSFLRPRLLSWISTSGAGAGGPDRSSDGTGKRELHCMFDEETMPVIAEEIDQSSHDEAAAADDTELP